MPPSHLRPQQLTTAPLQQPLLHHPHSPPSFPPHLSLYHRPASTDPSSQPSPPATATASTATAIPAGTAPCQTLYIHHLNEKTPLLDLRKSLYLLFSQFGHVLHVSAARTDTTRGQAWVVMGGVESAVRAVNEMDGLQVYGRPMKVEFAKEESDVARRARGETVPKREKRKRVGTAQRKATKLAQTRRSSSPASTPARLLHHAAAATIRRATRRTWRTRRPYSCCLPTACCSWSSCRPR